MTEDSDTADPPTGEQKSSKRERFRKRLRKGVDKFKKNDEDGKANEESFLTDDVKDFLSTKPNTTEGHSPSRSPSRAPANQQPKQKTRVDEELKAFLQKPSTADTLPPFPSPTKVPIPRIDVTEYSRWPMASEVIGQDRNDGFISTTRTRGRSESAPRHKARRKHLRVQFTEYPPVVIGEGGDDSEQPTKEISRARARSHSPMLESPRRTEPPLLPFGSSRNTPTKQPQGTGIDSTERQRPFPFSRTPTGYPSGAITRTTSQHQEFELSLASPASEAAPAPISKIESLQDQSTLSTNPARLKMRAEEGKSLRERFQDTSLKDEPSWV